MGKVSIHIVGWDWIQCSETNINWTVNRSHLEVKTNAIHLSIPEEFIKIERVE